MIIKRVRPDRGTFFAIWPRWTPEGWACLEWLHYKRVHDWGAISPWRYTRFVPDEEYDAGKRREFAP